MLHAPDSLLFDGLAQMLVFLAQADIFSLGIVLFELFLRKTMAALIMEGDYDPGLVEMFAYKVHQHTNEDSRM